MTHNPADCERIFVKWSWMVGVTIGLVSVVAGLSWASAVRIMNIEHRVEKIEDIKSDIQVMRTQLDTLVGRK